MLQASPLIAAFGGGGIVLAALWARSRRSGGRMGAKELLLALTAVIVIGVLFALLTDPRAA